MSQTAYLSEPRSIHIVGIGGAGMRAIASVLAAMGHRVSGSDLKQSPALDRLRAEGIAAFVGHDPSNLEGKDLLTRSTAVADSNPEVVAASHLWPTAEAVNLNSPRQGCCESR